MKKGMFVLVALVMLLTAVAVTPAQAFTGVSGTVVDNNNDPWTYGGTVTLYGEVGGVYQEVGSGNINTATGVFDVAYTSDPDDFTEVLVLVEFNAGPGGQPGTTQLTFTEVPSTNRYNAGKISTNTGPTAITLQGVNAAETGSPALLAGVALLLLAGSSLLVLRRRVMA